MQAAILRKALGARCKNTAEDYSGHKKWLCEQESKQNTGTKGEHMHLFRAMLRQFKNYLPSDFIFVAFQVSPRSNLFPRGKKSFL